MNGQYHNPNDNWLPQTPEERDAMVSAGCLGGAAFVVMMFIAFTIMALLASCSPKIIEREVVKTDTCFIQKERIDSVYLKDSVYIKEWVQGDTVRIETLRWRDRWRERIIRDTSYVSVRDTIKVTTTREVAKPLSSWQQFQIWCGRLALIAIALTLGIIIIRRRFFS